MKKNIYIGTGLQQKNNGEVKGELTEIAGEVYYVIHNYNQMNPFFITVVSDSNHWMYLSSNGSLTAGRANPDQALFPYYTDDKIHDSEGVTGPKTIVFATHNNKTYLWEPFLKNNRGTYNIERNLYKKCTGNAIIFEELNLDLNLTFRYSWGNSEKFGWVRESSLHNNGGPCRIKIADGLQNILPWGINRNMQDTKSTLVDAYKKSELLNGTSLALFRLSSIPVDKAEPSEALKTNTVWSVGLDNPKYLLSNLQLTGFLQGKAVQSENEKRGIKGAYFVQSEFELNEKKEKKWVMVAEVARDAPSVVENLEMLKDEKTLLQNLENDIERGTKALETLVARADGLQLTGDQINEKRHFSNTLFNIMRGGIPQNGYAIEKADFEKHLVHFNKPLAHQVKSWLNSLPEKIRYTELLDKAVENGNNDLIRLSLEYLPLMFSRRHGDPSRPWNIFDIKLKNDDGSPSLYYQGNWRDIFQNWEALAKSYPVYVRGMIAKFLNASTIDGYNPYRITRDGIDWEMPDPSDPWANIGYWGDHQVIYLEKLLELSERFFPGQLENWMNQSIFTYANVPYEHKPYEQLLDDPRDTIIFNAKKHKEIEKRVEETGADGKLVMLGNKVLKVNFTEKALVPVLSKISNFVAGAGIWMNTQRPEWNDANNALVGYGTSMVTLYYMRRYVRFLIHLFQKSKGQNWHIHSEVLDLFTDLNRVLTQNLHLVKGDINGRKQKQLLDQLGRAGSIFRKKVYAGLDGKTGLLNKQEVIAFLNTTVQFIDHSIASNKRPDGLYHAYNLISFKGEEIVVRHLSEMLEGQVAVLSSGLLNAEKTDDLLKALRESNLYRFDQRSYMLYPNKKLPGFLEKNILDPDRVKQSKLLSSLISDGDASIVVRDVQGDIHFNGSINNAQTLKNALNKLPEKYHRLVNEEETLVSDIYEEVFDHQSFTGRSGSFYKYEGLGCIYWHMVSKLLLAAGENIRSAQKSKAKKALIEKLEKHYAEIREGIGSHKSPVEYGAFPTDPYSHTPSMAGVQQPGMTGQVKEDLLSRWMELGVDIENGKIIFNPECIDKKELLRTFSGSSLQRFQSNYGVEVPAGKYLLAFAFCGVPVFYIRGHQNKVEIVYDDGQTHVQDAMELSPALSSKIFNRDGTVISIRITFKTT
ncbi:MAG: hypothetical protein K9H26_10620 [Prolixibacteraceae bacterium]|nr:hypothetical protein [Prolixibacteraceae bacterium]